MSDFSNYAELKFLHSGRSLIAGEELLDFQFTEEYFRPTSSWNVSIADRREMRDLISIGAKVQLSLWGRPQVTGYVESIESSKGVLKLSGRDILAPVQDSYMDPHFKIAKGDKLEDVIKKLLNPFGITSIDVNNKDNIEVSVKPKAKRQRHKQSTDWAIKESGAEAKSKDRDLKITEEQCKPGNEGVLQFIQKLLDRASLHMWAKADGSGVVISGVDFEEPLYTVYCTKDSSSIVSSSLKRNVADQSSVIVGYAKTNSSKQEVGRCKAIAINELVATDKDFNLRSDVSEFIQSQDLKDATVLDVRNNLKDFRKLFGDYNTLRPMYIIDNDSKSQEQLEKAIAKKLAQMTHKAFEYQISFQGNVLTGVNTQIKVQDDFLGVSGTFWIESKRFSGNNQGFITELTLRLPYTVAFE